ncbi:ABC transporter ATP-binding protein [Aquimarina muelleri]|uniref:ABC transporter ATP-binding protein n=1 Tax=Aquimarina muelleri TaxID=279356 RepID=A0A918JV13_9FLAO|nr:ABC transporter ATP-binding protein [Aquimarina muelleri]MCX2762256.1 ABC transporter ATP-binding protein [Aquimarina muelleri]GGX18023.1 ABC transporter ATP-binding protein [Aquimarina muelleri]
MLQAINLTKKYHNHIALDSLNLTVNKGDVFCLLGQNGAGKTTTINLFLGFISPSKGKALINGVLVQQNDKTTKKSLAYIPEVVMLYSNLTSIENLDFFSRLAGFTYSKEELENFLLSVGLPNEAFYKRLGQYSKGMRQKVGIAIAIAKNADVLLMDEPTSGLDPMAINEFTELVKDLSNQGKTTLIATHDLLSAAAIGTRVGIMRRGCLVHEFSNTDINANELQEVYLETIL